MRDYLAVVARPEGAYQSSMNNDLVWRTADDAGAIAPSAPPLLANQGLVYFIRAGRTNAVKIGWTANAPENRLRELQCGNQHQLHLVGHLPGTLFDEADWHSRFAAERIRGEWFALSLRLRNAVNVLSILECGFVQYLPLSMLTRNAR